ncbi:MAG TPA: peptide ABC transporter substrate-binding protein [Opitutus sp.]|nr:peptide ABC transporter substrate-binding protein [Opitutus sp.]
MRRSTTRSGALRLLAACALATIVGACSRPPSTAAEKTLRVSQRNEPADLDPATASLPDEFFVIRALGEGLLLPNPAGGEPLAGIAERFDVSPDGLVYTFHLRADLKWSNGEPLTASDVIASFQRALAPATAAPKVHLFFPVKNARAYSSGALADFSEVGFRVVDARTLAIALERPLSPFSHYVASGPWIPVNPRVVAAHGRTWTQPAHHVGNGSFVLAEWSPQQRIVVRKNPHYRNAAHVPLAKIEFLRFDSTDTEERAFRAGQIDVTVDVPKTKIAAYAREHPAELHRLALAETRYLSFNTTRAPLGDARVRRALSLALDRAKLVERVLLGGQIPAKRFLSPAMTLTAAAEDASNHDPELARRLLADAGFAGGRDFPSLELTAWSPSQLPLLEAIQATWRAELGVEVRIALHEAKVHLAALSRGDYDLAFITSLPDVPDAAASLAEFVSDAAGNYPRWRSAEFDALVAAGDLAAAEARLVKQAPVAPLYFNVQNWLMSPRVRGWKQDAFWNRAYVDVDLVAPAP